MKTLRDFNLKGKRALVRCDFNVPLTKSGEILDDFRIKNTIPTIEYLIEKGAKVILMSHLGRPKGKVIENLRLTPIQDRLMEYLDLSVTKAPDCIGPEIEDWTKKMQPGEILLLENLRFHKEETEGELNFARKLSKLADIYINDAFSASHRNHASVAGVSRYLPSGAGLLLEREIKILSNVLEKPRRPLVVIIGGIKIATKIKLIEHFLKTADHLLLGGEIANCILRAKGICLGKLFPESEILERIKNIKLTDPRLHLPIDGIISLDNLEKGLKAGFIRKGGIGTVRREEKIYDIGPETIKLFSRIIKGSEISFWKGPLEYVRKEKTPKTILWNGPLGLFENERFEKGTKEIAEAIIRNHEAFKIAGGGETVFALNKFGLRDKFDHVSTGGGAMLAYLSGEKLPGIEALRQ